MDISAFIIQHNIQCTYGGDCYFPVHVSMLLYIYFRCITIRYTAPSGDIFYNPGNLLVIATKILELISDLQLAENPVFFHVFSNGGCMVYRYITELMHTDPTFISMRMQGAIFDSCPSERKPLIAARAFIATFNNMNVILKYFAAFFLLLFFYCSSFVTSMKSAIIGKSNDSGHFWDAIKKDPAKCPQLYLYSKADNIVSYIAVEDQIRIREARVRVLSVCWEDSGHVAHLKVHREAYMKQCQDFIDMCMDSIL
jgi:hypothetical protein